LRALLDTHALLWWLDEHERLSPAAYRFIEERSGEIFVSAASAWEIATKVRIGKLPNAVDVALNFFDILEAQEFIGLDVTVAHALGAGALPGVHRDPWDRMLIAQAQAEGLVLISNEHAFDYYGVQRLW